MANNAISGHVTRALTALVAVLLALGCQQMDRLPPDPVASEAAPDARGTLLDSTEGPVYDGGRLTQEAYSRQLRVIMDARGEERLALANRFLHDYPIVDTSGELHELIGDALSELGRPAEAAAAWQRAVEMAWPPNDLLGLPQSNLELPYQIGWAHFEAGDAALGADWLTRATFISDRPQLEQGLRFVFSELGSPSVDFETWLADKRDALAVPAPDFELPGYGFDALRLSGIDARLTLINFWTPT